ncbi:hypothetical protein TNCV_3303031 [Trichonephila clavipes]|nr:hypothetical protein TNCV_3303031 [Trichonephila clavipes]
MQRFFGRKDTGISQRVETYYLTKTPSSDPHRDRQLVPEKKEEPTKGRATNGSESERVFRINNRNNKTRTTTMSETTNPSVSNRCLSLSGFFLMSLRRVDRIRRNSREGLFTIARLGRFLFLLLFLPLVVIFALEIIRGR